MMDRRHWFPAALLIALALCLPRSAWADSHEQVVNDCVAEMDRMATAVLSVKDSPTADKAVTTLMSIADNLKKIAARAETLGQPSEEAGKAMMAKMDAAQAQMKKRLVPLPAQLKAAGPEAASILAKGMDPFMKAMVEVGQAFEKADEAPAKK